jgi:CRP/FNR family transcriptional regulator, cyclic AMP receptor protein
MSDNGDLLARSDMFLALDEPQIQTVLDLGEVRTFSEGAVIVEEDEKAEACFLVLSGRVDIEVRATYSGRGPQKIATMKRGEVFGELSLVDGFLRSATARAVDSVEVLTFDNTKLEALMAADPALGYRIMKNVANILSGRIRVTNMKLRNALSDILYY